MLSNSHPSIMIFLFCFCSAVLLFSPRATAAQEADESNTDRWTLLTGYGSSHPGWGETETRLETVDLALRRETVIFRDIGDSWYAGYHSLLLELPVHFLLDGDTPMVGVNFLANYTFSASRFRPYFFAGGGPVYVDADIPGMGSDWNGNYQIGAGVHFPWTNDHTLVFETRYHHISNAGIESPNVPLNSLKFLVGFTF